MTQLFAVYKGKMHKGNSRGESNLKAIQIYLIDSGFSKHEILSEELLKKYNAIIAIKGIHY